MKQQEVVAMSSEQRKQRQRERQEQRKAERLHEHLVGGLYKVTETEDSPTLSWVELCGAK